MSRHGDRFSLKQIADHLRRRSAPPPGLSDDELGRAWTTSDDARDLFAVAALSGCQAAIGRAACACAREALEAVPTKSSQLERALDVADAWFRGTGSAKNLEAAHATAYSLYHSGPHDLSFNGEAFGSAQAAVMGATTDPARGEDVAMDAANAIACASDPADRDEMRERRSRALRVLAEVCRVHLPCPDLKSLTSRP